MAASGAEPSVRLVCSWFSLRLSLRSPRLCVEPHFPNAVELFPKQPISSVVMGPFLRSSVLVLLLAGVLPGQRYSFKEYGQDAGLTNLGSEEHTSELQSRQYL